MSKNDSESFIEVMTKILPWVARGFLVPTAGIMYDSMKLIWFGLTNNQPEILLPYTLIALLGFFGFIIAIYVGFISSPDSAKEFRVELAQLRQEVEALKELLT